MSTGAVLRTAAVVALVLTASCVGVVTGDRLEFTADEVTVSEDAVAASGFEFAGADSVELSETVAVAGIEREVHLTSYVETYTRDYQGEPLAHAVVMATPQVSVLGQGANPLGLVDRDELVREVVGRTEGVDDLRRVGEREIRVLGQDVTVTKFEATAEQDGEEQQVYVHLLRFDHEGDYVIAVAMYPTELADVEPDVFTLFEGISR